MMAPHWSFWALCQPVNRLLLTTCIILGTASVPLSSMAQMPDYAYYYNQGNALYEKGQLSQAIEMYEKAMPLAQGLSIPIAYNNLATIYMRRGNYYLSQTKQLELGLDDFRKAYYLLNIAWPEGMEKSDRQRGNTEIAKSNLAIGYQNLKVPLKDVANHLDMAKKLRHQGQFQSAIVEYDQVLEVDPQNEMALKALGDLFNVLNVPEKSRKYYVQAVKALGDRVDDELLVRLATAQNKFGEIDSAVANFNKALDINPSNSAALKQLEDIWVREIRFNPRSVLGHANLAAVMQKKKLYPEALRAYTQAENYAAQDRNTTLDTKKLIRLNMGTLYQQMGDLPMALKAYDSVLELEPGNRTANEYKASLYRDSGQSEDALVQYQKLLTLDPNDKALQDEVLSLIQKRSNPGLVLSGLKEFASRYPQNAVIQARVGELLHGKHEFEAAIPLYQKALVLDPNLTSAAINLGAALESVGRMAEAAAIYQKAAIQDPKNPQLKQLLAQTQQNAGAQLYQDALAKQQAEDYPGAIGLYQKALAYPAIDSAELRANYGLALQSAQQVEEALKQYGLAIQKDGNNGNYPFYQATAFQQLNRLPAAIEAYQKALASGTLDPENQVLAQSAIQSLGQAEAAVELTQAVEAYEAKQYPKALGLIQKALAKDPTNATAYYYQGLVYSDQNQLPQSIQSFQNAIAKDEAFKDAYFSLGVALEKKSDKPGAKSAFQRFLQLTEGTEDDFVAYARERVGAL